MPKVPGEFANAEERFTAPAESSRAPASSGSLADLLDESEPSPATQPQAPTESLADLLDEGSAPDPTVESGRLNSALGIAQETPPDRAARILKLSGKTGLPSLFLADQLDEVEKEAEQADFNPEEYRRSSPKLAKWLESNPHHFAYAKEDLGFLQKLERSVKALGEGWEKARLQDELAGIVYDEMTDAEVTPQRLERRDAIKRRMGEIVEAEEQSGLLSSEGVPRAGAYAVGQFAGLLPSLATGAAAGAAVGAPFGGVGAAPGALAGARVGSAYHTYRTESALTFDEFRGMKDVDGRPMDLDAAKTAAMGVGVINAAIELGTFGPMTRLIPGFDKIGKRAVNEAVKRAVQSPATRGPLVAAARKMMTAGFIEGGEEFIQSLAQALGREAAQSASGQVYDPDSLADDIGGALNEAAHAVVGTGVTFGLGSGVATYAQRRRQIREAKENAAMLDELAKAEPSKAGQALPEKREEAVREVLKDSAAENQFIDPGVIAEYAQSKGVEPRQFVAELIGEEAAQEFDQAVALKHDMKISTARYDATIGKSEHHAFFVREVRSDPEKQNMREAEEEEKQIEADLEAESQKAEGEAAPAPVEQDSAKQVRALVEKQLQGAGFQPDVIAKYADLYEERYRTRGALLGQDPLATFQAENIAVQREGLEAPAVPVYDPLDALLDRVRAGDIPSDREARGASLIDFLRDSGGIRDDQGDVASMEPDAGLQPFQRKLVQELGKSLDEAAILAAESGYIAEADPRALLDAIDSELRGKPLYSAMNADQNLVSQIETLNRLRTQIGSLGLDLSTMDNAEVKRRLSENEGVRADVGFEQTLFQQVIDASERFKKKTEGKKKRKPTADEVAWRKSQDQLDEMRSAYFERRLSKKQEKEFESLLRETNQLERKMRKKNLVDMTPQFQERAEAAELGALVRSFLDEPRGLTVEELRKIDQRVDQINTLLDEEIPDDVNDSLMDELDTYLYMMESSNEIKEKTQARRWANLGVVREDGVEYFQSGRRPYEGVPDSLMGFSKNGGGKPFEEQKYRHIQWVRVKFPGTEDQFSKEFLDSLDPSLANLLTTNEIVDAVKGLNQPHALERARRNWPAATEIEALTEEQAQAADPENYERGRIFFQGDKHRGSVRFTPYQKLITIMQGGDLSTFLHESGHLWLDETMRDIATLKARAPESLTETQKAFLAREADLLKFLEVESWDKVGREQHERFAETFERYLHTGEAPSAGLREAFRAFRAWLIEVFKRMGGIPGKPITPEIKAVFDRLLATEEQITEAQAEMGDIDFPGEPEELTRAKQDAVREAEEKLGAKLIAQERRKQEKSYEEEWDRMASEVALEVDARPVYQALFRLQARGEGSLKLSKADIVKQFGKARLARLPRPYVYTTAATGIHPDLAASQFGFGSGDELLHALETAPKRDAEIVRLTDERMKALHGEILTDGTLPVEAMKSLHNDKRAQVHRMRLEFLWEKRRGQFKEGVKRAARRIPTIESVRNKAESLVRSKQVREVRPGLYRVAERKAQREALDFYLKGDFENSYRAQLRALMNHELYRAATEAREIVERGSDYANALARSKRRRGEIGKAGQEWLEQVDSALERYSFKSPSTHRRAQSLLEWAQEVKEETGEMPALSDSVVDESRRVHYLELSVEEFVGVIDSLKSIEQVAKVVNQARKGQEMIAFGEAKESLVSRILETIPNEKGTPETRAALSSAERLREKIGGAFLSTIRPEFVIEILDGGKTGPFHDLLWNLSVDAQVKRDDLRKKVFTPLIDILARMSGDQQKLMNESVYLKTMGQSLQRRTIIGVMLNLGNESNKRKLMEGGKNFNKENVPITQAMIDEMMTHISAEGFQMVQTIWDAIDPLFAELDALNRRTIGLPLEKVEPTPLVTPHGTLRGGYWPAVRDPFDPRSGKTISVEVSATDIFPSRYRLGATVKTARQERTAATYPLDLDFASILQSHVHKVTTDIAYHEFVSQARRLLKDKDVMKAIQNHAGHSTFETLLNWLEDQVQGMPRDQRAKDTSDISAWFTSNTVVAAMGFHYVNAIGSAVTAPLQAMAQVNPVRMLEHFARYALNSDHIYDEVVALSGEMKHRSTNLDQTLQMVAKELEGKDTLRARIARLAMQMHTWQEKTTGTVIWYAKYEQSIAEGMSVEQAVRAADKVVRTTQMQGAIKDLSSFERSDSWKWAKLFIGPLLTLYGGAYADAKIAHNKGGWGGVVKDPKTYFNYLTRIALPVIVFEITQGRGPDDWEDPEEILKWMSVKSLLAPFLMIPVVKEGAVVIENALLGKPLYASEHPLVAAWTAIGKAAVTVGKSAKQALNDEEVNIERLVKSVIRAIGPATGLPTGQLMREGKGFVEGAGAGAIGRGARALISDVNASEMPPWMPTRPAPKMPGAGAR